MIARAGRILRGWWPLLAAVALGSVIYASYTVVSFVADERAYFEAEKKRDELEDEQTREVVQSLRRAESTRDERLGRALDDVEQLLADQFAEHDYNVATKLNDLLAQIAALLGRPAGVAVDPVVAIDGDGSPTPPQREPRERPQPTTTTAPPSTTTTTSPGRSGLCERHPSIPLCRRPR